MKNKKIQVLLILMSALLVVSLFSILEYEKEDTSSKGSDSEKVDISFIYIPVSFNDDGNKVYSSPIHTDKYSYDKGAKYNYQVRDYFDKSYYAKTGDYISGSATVSKNVSIELYEIFDFLGCSEPQDGKTVVEITSLSAYIGNLNCISLENNFDADITSVDINIYDDDYVTLLGSYTLSNIKIPAGGYLIIFPATGEIVGYHGADSFKTMKKNSDFADFYKESCEKYLKLLGD